VTTGDDPHLLDRLAVVHRHRVVVVLVLLLSVVATAIQRSTSAPQYQARARILIDEERSAILPNMPIPVILAEFANRERYVQGQYQILKSRDLAMKAVKQLKIDQPAPAFISHVGLEPLAGTQLVDVTFTAPDAMFATQAVNALVQTYVDNNLDVRLQSRQKMVDWLDEQLADQLNKVRASERKLAEYRESQTAPTLDEHQDIVTPRLNKLSDDALRAAARRLEKESMYKRVKAMPPDSAADILPIVAHNESLKTLNAELRSLEQEHAQAAERYGDKHPAMQSIATRLTETRRRRDAELDIVLQSLENDYQTAVLEERSVNERLGAVKADIADAQKADVRYRVLEAEANTIVQMYDSLLAQENALRLLNSSRSNNVRVVDRADPPTTPLASSRPYSWLVGIVVGLFLAVAIAFGLEYMDDTIKTPDDVVRRLGLVFLGMVPKLHDETATLMAAEKAPEEFSEAFRAIRTAIRADSTRGAGGVTSVVVTSTQPLEGKTTTACNIAMSLALSDARVLLIDADMRRPSVHRTMRLKNDRGLSHLLLGSCRLRDAVQPTAYPNLIVVSAGASPHNAADLLTSERMKVLLKTLQDGPFDWIIIDTPPVTAVTDAVGLAPLVAGVVFVVGAEVTRRRGAESAVQTLRSSQPHFFGAVLNRVDVVRNKYYYSRHYGYQYKDRYAKTA
jgi:capsular exopolysaccharide synthesis family protein